MGGHATQATFMQMSPLWHGRVTQSRMIKRIRVSPCHVNRGARTTAAGTPILRCHCAHMKPHMQL